MNAPSLQSRLDAFYESRYYWPTMAIILGAMLIIFIGIIT